MLDPALPAASPRLDQIEWFDGRYALFDEIAAGGMATVHLGRLAGHAGFARTVAIKRMHPFCARDPDFVAMFIDEARLAGRVRHPNVISTLDVVAKGTETLLVMEYVHGAPLSALTKAVTAAGERVPLEIASSIVVGVLRGLHAAHEATDERGHPLEIVHRDVSPQNVIVGVDGIARVLDFGVAKAAARLHTTRDGTIKGKLKYMSPEQLNNKEPSRRTDVYAASVVMWELLTGKRMFDGDNDGSVLEQILMGSVEPPSRYVPELPHALDRLVMRGAHRDASKRFEDAAQMAEELEALMPCASSAEVGRWVEHVMGDTLRARARRIQEIEATPLVVSEAQTSPHVTVVTRKKRTFVLAAIATAVLAIAGMAWWRHASRAEPPSDLGRVVVSASPVNEPSSSGPPSAPSTAPSATSTQSSAPAQPSHSTKARATSKKGACNPPYTVDALGRKLWKRECL